MVGQRTNGPRLGPPVGSPRQRTSGEDSAWQSLRDRVTISLRPIGAPTAIGFFGLAAASLVLSGLQLGWVPVEEGRHVALALIGFVFVAQLLAGVFSLLARDGVAATAMLTLALVWLTTGLIMYTSRPGATSAALGMFLLFAGIAMTLTGLTAGLSKLVPAAVFLVAALRFLTTAGYQLTAVGDWKTISGVIGLVLFALAAYAGWAAELENAVGRTVLPLGRRDKGRIAVTGSLMEQVRDVVNEPGVRQQL
jgi:succinate-acetate transporter protein